MAYGSRHTNLVVEGDDYLCSNLALAWEALKDSGQLWFCAMTGATQQDCTKKMQEWSENTKYVI